MKVLIVGGTGTISTAITVQMASEGHDVYVLNRGHRTEELKKMCEDAASRPCCRISIEEIRITSLVADISKQKDVHKVAFSVLQKDEKFDVVADFIAYTLDHVKNTYEVFKTHTRQYIFISTASAYQKPLSNYKVTESTPLMNPYSEYSRNKIDCENFLMEMYRKEGFPITIVRPSHTYDERSIPLGVHGQYGSWQVLKRMLQGKKVIIHGDGTSLWTMTHNSDFARGFIGLMGNIRAIGEAVQITSEESLSWNQIYTCIATALGVELRAVHISSDFLVAAGNYDFTGSLIGDKAHSIVFDNTKLRRLVPGFYAQKRFDQGCRETVQNVLSHSELQKDDPDFDAWCDRVIAVRAAALKAIGNNFY